ncbi:hypothetical protein EIN_469550 [Entamoeba invadens IP1]|uniref:CMP/dCMP-type deaminase domain-containing protein n=1 Tax=Entamoeba invadens IP1 TaxID=370355 RepID=A0A0A1TYY4_ENTIV|nr:hypothetical protein EIN_469550 [Entamoeba invadens IP1]ELP83741.1 hypothetical protein EIN_469550 [Entamoeba invadens IP1]|eukprot:XP_004183087.1 hypothetical protein EIN_469550 [Entamoeba invadens IP1]
METDKKYMSLALEIGREALKALEVPVGCVIVTSDGKVVAQGRNRTKEFQDGTLHAEIVCIDQLVEHNINFQDCTLYVTCEPCIMCASALVECGITKIIYGCSNQRFGGCGSVMTVFNAQYYTEDKPDHFCMKGFMEDEGLVLLKDFFSLENASAPEPCKKRKVD